MPFPAGTHPKEVTLANFGANTITNTTIGWSVNGVVQSPYAWTGSLTSGTKESNIDIGDMAMEQYDLTAYPNPARTFVKLRSELFADQDIKTTLISNSGAIVKVQEFTPVEIYNHEIEFYFPAISPGSYMMVVQVGEIMQVKNIIVLQ